MKVNSVLIVGCGDLGIRVGTALQALNWHVCGVRRDPSRLPTGFEAIAADCTLHGSLGFLAASHPDYVLATFTPDGRSEEGYRRGFVTATQNLLAGLGGHRPRALIMVSSTRVYAESEGGWVDESSALVAGDPGGEAIVEGEQLLRASGHNTCIVRCAGLYGSPDSRLLERVRRGHVCAPEPLRYSNRIHRDDCAGFLRHLILLAQRGVPLAPVYVAVDDLPTPQFEVEAWLARRLGVEVSTTGPAAIPAGRKVSAHKRCRNTLLHATGFELQFPDFLRGYEAVLAGGG